MFENFFLKFKVFYYFIIFLLGINLGHNKDIKFIMYMEILLGKSMCNAIYFKISCIYYCHVIDKLQNLRVGEEMIYPRHQLMN